MQFLLKLRKWVKASRLRMAAGVISLAVSLCCAAVAVGCLLPLSFGVGKLAFAVAAEPVYEAPAQPDADYNGRLVKLRGSGLSTDYELEDEDAGVKQKALVLRRAVGKRTEAGKSRYGSAAPSMQLGNYRLLNTPVAKIWPFQGPAPKGAVKVKSVPGGEHVLSLPTPSKDVVWYVIGRQQGSGLHMEDPAACFCTREEWEECSRAFDIGAPEPFFLFWNIMVALLVLFICLWGTVACWRSAWSCLADIKEYSRIPAWLTALFCSPAFALLGGGGVLLQYYILCNSNYQYASVNTMAFLFLSGLALLVVWYRLRRWFKFRMMF